MVEEKTLQGKWGRNVKVSDETFDMLYEKAETLGVSLNDVIRQMDKKCNSIEIVDEDGNPVTDEDGSD